MNISISELSTIPQLVFSVWTSLSASRDAVTESPREEEERTVSENSRKLPRMMPSFGSSRPSAEPSSTEESIWPANSFTSLLGEVDHVFSDVIELWRKELSLITIL